MNPDKLVGKIGYEILDGGFRFFSLTEEEIEVGFILRLITSNAPIGYHFYTFKQKGEWCIPFFDYTGCGIVTAHHVPSMREFFRVIVPNTFSEKSEKQNLISVGLNKTGTSSLKKDLVDLGYKLYPEELSHQYVFPDVYQNHFHSTFSALDNPRYNLYQDLPYSIPNMYQNIFSENKNDIYLLTVRNSTEEFVDSFIRYYDKYFQFKDRKNLNQKTRYHYNHFYVDDITLYNLHFAFFQFWGFDNLQNLENKVRDVYNKHVDGCVNFFESRNYKNFRIVNVSQKGELKKLSDWLGLKNERQDFSWENKSE
jgi:hypothetical protein